MRISHAEAGGPQLIRHVDFPRAKTGPRRISFPIKLRTGLLRAPVFKAVHCDPAHRLRESGRNPTEAMDLWPVD